jgi:hypothetical protein
MGSSRLQGREVMVMGSGRKQGKKILGVITPERAEAFLLDIANPARVPDEDANKELLRKYPEIAKPLEPGGLGEQFTLIRIKLQRAWIARDDRHRDWHLYELRRKYRDTTAESDPLEPPKITPFEASIFYFQTRVGDKAKHCGHEDCPAPYFIAKKRWQKFCSEACAGPANRESKRKWWRENRA